MATSSTLMLVGDVVAQQIELASARRKNETPGHFLQHRQVLLQPSWLFPAGIELQLTRTSVMCTWAGLMGLFWTAWFRRMDLIFHKLPKLVGVIGKVAATAITPPFTNTAFMGIVTMIEETVINGRGDDPEYCALSATRARVLTRWTIMASMDETELQHLYAWIDKIPLSRPKRNITRDFSDGVMVAEVVNHFVPRIVEMHNYSPASSSKQKQENWGTLNSKVFKKLGLTVPESVVKGVIANKPGVIEVVLSNLRVKIEQYQNRSGSAASAEWGELNPAPVRTGGRKKNTGGNRSPSRPHHHANGSSNSFDVVSGPPYDEIEDPTQALMEKDQSIIDYQETVEILQVKVRKLEQLVKLKDRRIDELAKKLERFES
ncbi:uncharacterized protein MONBRDRAFT_38733 [Monosiga brevicollis MX1]|uniref:Calponin-homology (CH) domain-containing protein n=1 Tax=Monosiga brevicollis TaxID=81824 RepID=A9V9T2_MONBE|nr:uncharacterized protein MONBRDRAFT_38733 [Monosiga brevicollis MX1]EDQ85779.1 predicted protein [Monosiga brevicollis MX1]|eukprot:XP_001749494.1 hypothetical protein [Monosiga brevicollis MX1]